jgi:putative DNA primase/helicase
VIDPLTAYMGETQAQRNASVRKALTPLVKLIEEFEVLVIGVTHLNKSAAKAIYRVLDSIAFVALGRVVHLVVADPNIPENRLFLCDKTNIGPKPDGLSFMCQSAEVPTQDGNIWVSQISWGTQYVTATADEALSTRGESGDKRSARGEAKEFLQELLANGPVASKAVLAAAEANGITGVTLRRAKKNLGVEAKHDESFEGAWKWCLPSPR